MMQQAIFITGAGTGIGAAVAQLFLTKGWKVGLYDINQTAVTELAQQYTAQQAHAGFLDVTNADNWRTALQDFFGWSGRLDVLLNNAGILFSGPFEQTDLSKHASTFAVNVQGVMNGCHTALPFLQQTAGARVINMSSASAIYGQADLASYSASKFAIRGLTEALDIEWRKYNIRVLDVMPLFVKTNMVTDMNAGSVKKLGVRLTAQDVAAVIYKAATAPASHAKTHWPVGLPTKLMYSFSGMAPAAFVRKINQKISGH